MEASSGERSAPDAVGPIWRAVHTAVVLDVRRASDVRVLVVPVVPAPDVPEGREGETWRLPWWEVEGKQDHERAAQLTGEARKRLGLDVVVLRRGARVDRGAPAPRAEL